MSDDNVLTPEQEAQLRAIADGFVDEEGNPVEPLAYARRRLKLPTLKRVIKSASQDAIYDLELEDGTRLSVGGVADVWNPRKVEAAIGDYIAGALPYYTAKPFRTIGNALLHPSVCVLDAAGGATKLEQAKEWLAEFVGDYSAHAPVDLDDPEELFAVLEYDHPVWRGSDDRLYVRVPKLMRWVNTHYGQRVSDPDLRNRLARLGFSKPRNKDGQVGARNATGAVRQRRFFASAPGFDPEA